MVDVTQQKSFLLVAGGRELALAKAVPWACKETQNPVQCSFCRSFPIRKWQFWDISFCMKSAFLGYDMLRSGQTDCRDSNGDCSPIFHTTEVENQQNIEAPTHR